MSTGIGIRIKKERVRLGLSQVELAKRLGWSSKTTISKIENGEDNLTSDRIAKIAEALNVRPSYLMGFSEAEHTYEAGVALGQLIHDKDVLDRAIKLHHASAEVRETLFKVMDSMLQ